MSTSKHESILIALLIGLSPSMISCDESTERVPIFYNRFVSDEIAGSQRYFACELTSDDIDMLISQDADFCLFVYVPGCGTCDLVSITIDDYIYSYGAVINYCYLSIYSHTESSLPSISENSLVFFVGGKVTEIVDLSEYALDSEGFEEMMDARSYFPGVEILNPVYIENYYSSFYPSFEFYGFSDEIPEEGFYYRIDDEEMRKDRTILLIDQYAVDDMTEFFSRLREPFFDSIGFIGDDILRSSTSIEEYFGITEISTYTLVKYEGDEIYSTCSTDLGGLVIDDDLI